MLAAFIPLDGGGGVASWLKPINRRRSGLSRLDPSAGFRRAMASVTIGIGEDSVKSNLLDAPFVPGYFHHDEEG